MTTEFFLTVVKCQVYTVSKSKHSGKPLSLNVGCENPDNDKHLIMLFS